MEDHSIDRTFKMSENVDFGAKFNQEISIHVVSLTSGSKDEGNVK